jgi:hypothetical protein
MRTNSSLIGNERRTSIKFVPDRPGGSAAEVPQSLFGHGGKDRLRRCAAGDQDCQTSQRSLSVGELAQFLRGLDVGHVSDLLRWLRVIRSCTGQHSFESSLASKSKHCHHCCRPSGLPANRKTLV